MDRLEDVLTTEELSRRPIRPPDHAAENRVLTALAQVMAEAPANLLQRLAYAALDLCGGGSAGVSLAETEGDRDIFRWHAVAGAFAPYLHGTTPRDFSPCGTVLERNAVLLMDYPARHFPYIAELRPAVTELLLVPFHRGETPIGTVWVVAHGEDRKFDAEDVRLVTSLSRFASAAVRTVQAGREARWAEESFRTSEERRRLALDSAELGAWNIDPTNRTLTTDERFRTIFGVAGDACDYARAVAAVHPDDRAPVLDAIAAATRPDDPAPYAIEYRVVHPDGSVRWVFAKGRANFSAKGAGLSFDGTVADVTDRKQAEAILREKDERVKLLVDHATDYAVIFTDPAGVLVEWLGGAEAITGWRADEVIGKPAHVIFTPEDRAAGIPGEEMRTAFHEGRAEDARWHLRKDGTRFFANGVMSALRDGAGRLRGFGKVIRDTTDQKRAELELRKAHTELEERVAERTAELRRERAFLKAVLDNIQDGIVACDPDGVLTLFNRVALEFHGLAEPPAPVGEWAGYSSLRRPDGRTPMPRDEIPLFRALRGERVHDVELVIDPTGGSARTVLVNGQPLLDADGRNLGAVVSVHDISDRKGREEAQAQTIREQARSDALRKVALASRTMNSVLSVESIAGIVAAEARSIVGAHVAATSLTSVDDPAHAIHTFAWSDKHGAFRSDPSNVPASTLHPLVENTTAPVRLSREAVAAHPLYHIIGTGVCGWPPPAGWLAIPLIGYSGKTLGFLQFSDKEGGEFNDDDEAVLLQLGAIAAAGIENARLYERLHDQDRRKDEFLATLAHELRNPLAPVRNGLHILRMSPAQTPAAAKVREMMERQLGHLVHLVDNLLDVSRVTSGKIVLKRERVELQAVVEAAVETSRPLIEAAGHRLTLDLPAEPMPLEADRNRLAQVLTNLVNNAAKYTPPGGAIHLRAVRDAAQVVVSVHDSGIGLPKEMLPKIFDIFTQVGTSLDRAQGGFGIGLTLVRKLVEMHGGTVAAESQGLGLGSTFTICLPLATGPSRAEPADTPGVAVRPAARRIVVVDDNVDGAESLALLLTLNGHEVRTAHSGPTGLAVVREFRPEVAILDIGLPGMNGYEVVKEIRGDPTLDGKTIIVALTGWGTDDDRRRAHESGFDHHLTKPVEGDRVIELLGKLFPNPTGR